VSASLREWVLTYRPNYSANTNLVHAHPLETDIDTDLLTSPRDRRKSEICCARSNHKRMGKTGLSNRYGKEHSCGVHIYLKCFQCGTVIFFRVRVNLISSFSCNLRTSSGAQIVGMYRVEW